MWTMLQGGIELTVSIGRPDVTQTELTVQTSLHPTDISLPIPDDSGWIEYDASTDLQAVINTKRDLRQTIDYFDKQFAADGWLGREKGGHVHDEKAWLSYIRGQQDVYLRLEQLGTGGTRIVIGDAARSSWQLTKPVVENQDKPGIEVADFALPAGASAVKFDVDAAEINFELPDTTAPKVGELFVKQMEAAGWKRDGAGIVDADYTFLTYTKEKAEIKLRARPAGTKVAASIAGDGLLWTKPLPTAPVRVSYDTWLRRNRLPASLGALGRQVRLSARSGSDQR